MVKHFVGGWNLKLKMSQISLIQFTDSDLIEIHLCSLSCVWLFAVPWTIAHQAPLSSKNTGVGCHFLPQDIFPIQGSNPCLQCGSSISRWILHSWATREGYCKSSLSRVWLFATPWTIAYKAPPSMGFSRQECSSGLPFPSPGDLPNLGIEPGLPHCRQMRYRLSHQGSPYKS